MSHYHADEPAGCWAILIGFLVAAFLIGFFGHWLWWWILTRGM